ncbi:MAG: glycosyltransferase family 2 protein [Lachnospiraceae bacterium]|nr:glycosyltransferase family 2 protein [Lachnospiraceae bacterium]MBQ6994499.1 glycosyltransferase family 2 protein [Lachnospiraceae bacterium]
MAKTTIVIPNYNGIKYIEACLESLFVGTDTDFEVIVVDNASKDGSLELVKEKFPQVTLIENAENTGFDKAVNQGILASKTPYVILLNNDTRVELSFVHELEKAIEQSPNIFSASAKMIALHNKEILDDAGDFYCALGWAFARGKGKRSDLYNKSCEIFASCAGAAIYRKEIFDEIGLFDEEHFAYLEDIDIGYRAQLYGYKNIYAPRAIVYHAGSATSGSRYNAFKTRLASQNSIYIIYKNMPMIQILINLPFLIVGFLIKTLFFIKKGLGKQYVFGLADGIRLAISKKGRRHKVLFSKNRIRYYVQVQCRLWYNLWRMILQK